MRKSGWLAAGITTLLLVKCHHAWAQDPAESARFELTVITAADFRTPIPGAEVVVIDALGGTVLIGVTDRFGALNIQVPRPWSAIVICHPLFSCSALRPRDVAGSEARTIAMGPLVLR
ncbi:MAG TPA: hypothetical protein VJ840_17750 [Gemmatimonadaceae bacterium]|nr:hypothetical protein [Gemmatimonadaceae bacterium]